MYNYDTIHEGRSYVFVQIWFLKETDCHPMSLRLISPMHADLIAQIVNKGGGQSEPSVATKNTCGISLDGGGEVISAGTVNYITLVKSGTIKAWALVADQVGDVVIDIWKKSGALPINNDSIVGNGIKPNLTQQSINSENDLPQYINLSVTAGDIIGFHVDSAAGITKATLTLTY